MDTHGNFMKLKKKTYYSVDRCLGGVMFMSFLLKRACVLTDVTFFCDPFTGATGETPGAFAVNGFLRKS